MRLADPVPTHVFTPRPHRRQNDVMRSWNYRVVQSLDGTEHFIAEVYYNNGETMGWVDDLSDYLRWENYDDLRNTVEMIREAFDKPVLRVTDDQRLVEVAS